MPNVKKLIEKMKQQPNGIRPEEVEKVLYFETVNESRGVRKAWK